MKIKNVGTSDYHGADVQCAVGETIEVDEKLGAYLLSDTKSPGKFEKVGGSREPDPAKDPAK